MKKYLFWKKVICLRKIESHYLQKPFVVVDCLKVICYALLKKTIINNL
jgi:hypothetical protein